MVALALQVILLSSLHQIASSMPEQHPSSRFSAWMLSELLEMPNQVKAVANCGKIGESWSSETVRQPRLGCLCRFAVDKGVQHGILGKDMKILSIILGAADKSSMKVELITEL
jgi:hypothetical protein